MFQSIDYLKTGNAKQQLAFITLFELNIMNDLKNFSPILCGTIPIGIDIESSDLDIITEVHNFSYFEEICKELYGAKESFKITHSVIRNMPVLIINFLYRGFEIELFCQATPVQNQNAYLHMVIEHALLKTHPQMKDEVIKLKRQGYKTEHAFCKILELEGDPYDILLCYGNEKKLL